MSTENTQTNECKKLRELIRTYPYQTAIDYWEELAERLERELTEKTNEVARLREALELIANATGGNDAFYYQELAQIALAPAPEEPTIKESLTVEPDWRELGPDEVIQEGDEWYGSLYGVIAWHPVTDERIATCVGEKCATKSGLFRTRRPLPNSPESEGIKKPEEMPLEGDIEDLENISIGKWGAPETRRIAAKTAHALRYLRDEIQKLKEAK